MNLARALLGLIRNRPLVFVEADSGEPADEWRVSRAERWYITRPGWFATALTRRLDCGCRKRLGWHAAYCFGHYGEVWS